MKGAQITRIRMNIKDLLLTQVPCLKNHGTSVPTVSLSKHLCGSATDLTLACLSKFQLSVGDANQVNQGTDGILIALCCHHRCTFDSYINLDYLERLGIHATEFDWIARMSSWATCGERESDTTSTPVQTDDEHELTNTEDYDTASWSYKPKLTHEERRNIGLKCKRL
jgi:tRNA:m4X modification enzyme